MAANDNHNDAHHWLYLVPALIVLVLLIYCGQKALDPFASRIAAYDKTLSTQLVSEH